MKLVAVILLLAPLVTTCLGTPVDCNAIHDQDNNNPSGVYNIQPVGQPIIEVYCDMTTLGGGWTVIQRRIDGSVDFNRSFAQYKNVFGSAAGEYWIGLDNIHSMTTGNTELLVEMEDFRGVNVHVRYTSFSVGPASDEYELIVSGYIDSVGGDSLTAQNGQKFSTFDNDQDSSSDNCAQEVSGASWFKDCSHANPNGVYGTTLWPSYDPQLNHFSMKIR